MSVHVDVTVGDPGWTAMLNDPEPLIGHWVDAVMAAAPPVAQQAEVGVHLLDDAAVQALNRDWRDQDKPTNVLSFPSALPTIPGEPVMLGDVMLARETVLAEAQDLGVPVVARMAHMVVHGVLHLLGFDHQADADAVTMEGLERQILLSLGLNDPYPEDEQTLTS